MLGKARGAVKRRSDIRDHSRQPADRTAVEQSDRGKPGGTGASDGLHRRCTETADREHRQRNRRADRRQSIDARGHDLRFRSTRKHRPKQQVVKAAVAFNRERLFLTMHRTADDESGGREGTNARGTDRVAAEVNAVGAGRQCHIHAIVDQHARRAAGDRPTGALDQSSERERVDLGLPDLYEMHSGPRG